MITSSESIVMSGGNDSDTITTGGLAAAAATANGNSGYLNETVIEICSPLSQRNNTTPYDILSLVIPSSRDHWKERTTAYWAFFYIMLAVFGILYLCLAVGCILLLAKRHLAQRFKVRTFIAIDVALMVLGFSRVLFFLLDPWGQSGFCNHHACIVISRLIGALAFPSLTAGYTLVLITLWISARMQLGLSCIQRLKIIIPLCFIHYGVAVVFEIMGSIPTKDGMVVVVLLVICEAAFSIWGFLVCFSFLITGHRLLKSVERSARSSSMICRDSPNLTRQQLVEKSKFQGTEKKRSQSTLKLKYMLREHHRRAIRKVSRITYITVLLGMLYSIVTFVNLILACLSLFFGCPGYLDDSLSPQNPGVWLMLHYVAFVLELLLAVLLTYSISDYRPILNLFCCNMRKVGSRQGSPSGVDSCTIESEAPSKMLPSTGVASPDSKTRDENVSSRSSLEASTEVSSSTAPNAPKKVTIFECDSTTVVDKAAVGKRNSNSSHEPKVRSPLTVSYSNSSNVST